MSEKESSVGKPEGKPCRKRIHFDRCSTTNTGRHRMDCRTARCAGHWAISGKTRADANTKVPIGKWRLPEIGQMWGRPFHISVAAESGASEAGRRSRCNFTLQTSQHPQNAALEPIRPLGPPTPRLKVGADSGRVSGLSHRFIHTHYRSPPTPPRPTHIRTARCQTHFHHRPQQHWR